MGNCLIFKLKHFKENIMIFFKILAQPVCKPSPRDNQTDKWSILETTDGEASILVVAWPYHINIVVF
jgi:hypothetical protein